MVNVARGKSSPDVRKSISVISGIKVSHRQRGDERTGGPDQQCLGLENNSSCIKPLCNRIRMRPLSSVREQRRGISVKPDLHHLRDGARVVRGPWIDPRVSCVESNRSEKERYHIERYSHRSVAEPRETHIAYPRKTRYNEEGHDTSYGDHNHSTLYTVYQLTPIALPTTQNQGRALEPPGHPSHRLVPAIR